MGKTQAFFLKLLNVFSKKNSTLQYRLTQERREKLSTTGASLVTTATKQATGCLAPNLPTELWIAIVGFIDGRRELGRLCLVSKLFCSIAGPRLYESLARNGSRFKMEIHSLLIHSQFENIINYISLKLETWSLGYDQWKCCQQSKSENSRCACDKLEERVGEALNNLPNLRVLRIHCFLCGAGAYKRHRYIMTLQTKILQEVKINCSCSRMDEKTVVEFFEASCMDSVVRLGWQFQGGTSVRGVHLDTALRNKETLPNLRQLYHGGDGLHDCLLRHRPIQRLTSTNTNASSQVDYNELIKKRNMLTHVSVYAPRFVKSLLNTISTDPLAFRNLQHIGTLHMTSRSWPVSGRGCEIVLN
jgi:hypothetical protein